MTVASQKAMSGPYLGNGLTTSFDYSFKIFDKSHLAVVLHKGDGERQQLIEGVDYAVAGVGADVGGQIMLNAPPLSGEEVTIIRNLPFVQEMDLENQGAPCRRMSPQRQKMIWCAILSSWQNRRETFLNWRL